MAQVQHCRGPAGLLVLAAGGGAKTAADRAREELAAFQQQQAEGGSAEEEDGQPYMKPSPSVSSGEEDEEGRGAERGKSLVDFLACVWWATL